MSDLRIAVRRLVRDPLFAVIAILTLAIGIGANSAIFTLVNGVLLAPLPFRDADRLVYAQAIMDGTSYNIFSSPVFLALQEHGRTFDGVVMFGNASATIGGDAEPERIDGASVSANYFDVLGIAPLVGRSFRAEENEPGSDAVVLLSESLWRARFGGEREIIGRTIELSGRAREVVGVMPASASFPPEWRFWVPRPYNESFRDPSNVLALGLNIAARLRPGVTLDQASAEVARIVHLAQVEADLLDPTYTGGVVPIREFYVGRTRGPLFVLLGAVAVVLLIACANLANLLLAQSAARSADFAVRRALGAGSLQLVRQLAIESLVLALAGGGAGLLLGAWGADALVRMLPPELPRMPGMRLDGNVVAFTFGVSLLAAVLFGFAPALQARRSSLAGTLREGGRGLATRSGARTRAALVLAETALAFALVISAGLLMRSFDRLHAVDPGFNVDRALSFHLSLPTIRYDSDERIVAFWDQLMQRLEAVAGAQQVGAIQDLPLGGSESIVTFEVEGRPPVPIGQQPALGLRVVTPGYFSAAGVPLRRGRLFDSRDVADGHGVALLSESAVERHFPGEDPIGKRIIMGWSRNGTFVQGEVVGVVGDVRHGQLRQEAQPEIYFVQAQVPRPAMSVVVRTAGPPLNIAPAVRQAVHQVDPTLAVARMNAVENVVAASVATDRFMTRLLTAFSGVALLLAAIGIFGVISYGVAQRRREIGVRMAIGAERSDVVRLIVSGALRLTGGGVIIGILAALALTRVLQSLLFGIRPTDPLTYAAGAAVVLTVALAASLVPAWSAARTPPASVLNSE